MLKTPIIVFSIDFSSQLHLINPLPKQASKQKRFIDDDKAGSRACFGTCTTVLQLVCKQEGKTNQCVQMFGQKIDHLSIL